MKYMPPNFTHERFLIATNFASTSLFNSTTYLTSLSPGLC